MIARIDGEFLVCLHHSLLQLLRVYVEIRRIELLPTLGSLCLSCSTCINWTVIIHHNVWMSLSIPSAFDLGSYQAYLQALFHATQKANKQNLSYHQHSTSCSFFIGDPVWLSIPMGGKMNCEEYTDNNEVRVYSHLKVF